MQSAEKTTQLLPGMYVRVPQEADRSSDFREFRIGQLRSINQIAFTASIHFNHPDYDEPTDEEFSLDNLERCRILPDTSFTTVNKKKSGRILIHCLDAPEPDQFMDYYVQFYGEQGTQSLSEKEIIVSSIRQNPLPESQLHHYEFQNPKWKSLRDQVIDSYHTLRNATYGIEDLVGSRIMLLSHQAEVVSRVLGDPVCRYILADEVGLGKTIEASVILRGLQRRDPLIKTLIIAPSSLTQQWQNELDSKFWLYFPLLQAQQKRSTGLNGRGYIVSIEDLVQDQSLWNVISNISWGLLIVDEAHHLRKDPQAYERVRYISQHSQRALILSATPIQRRASEYLKLLALMDPNRYGPDDKETFTTMLTAQNKIRRKVVTLAQNLNPDEFDAEEFEDEFDGLLRNLKHDQVLRTLVKDFSNASAQTPAMATQILAYISENYRIESRVIRNRRAHLTIPLPQRELDTSYSYIPAEEETVALDTLYDYVEAYTQSFSAENLEGPSSLWSLNTVVFSCMPLPVALTHCCMSWKYALNNYSNNQHCPFLKKSPPI
ncbi:DEAD/DEAH box helicase [Dictyobacter kobayashii]|uniref:Helicase ATP-binding domain-containing protein n=1 Tax=Dictyobacter kobayashii TaxID=2014872 RepID=A0A402AVR4_9CHLR|nr:DEAD/DEAH box helicase [Dictyobacter kobayashii]GCE23211.1 hypothetical protein KDK_70110 [Dictyobacter kobayashii]